MNLLGLQMLVVTLPPSQFMAAQTRLKGNKTLHKITSSCEGLRKLFFPWHAKNSTSTNNTSSNSLNESFSK